MTNERTLKIVEHSKNKTVETQQKAINAINEMKKNGEKITYYSVRQKTGISKSFLYNNEEVSALIRENVEEERSKITSPEHEEYLKLKKENKSLKKRIEELEEELEACQKLLADES